jgi:hypothetical protein
VTAQHFLVFIAPSRALSDELSALKRRFGNLSIVAPVPRKQPAFDRLRNSIKESLVALQLALQQSASQTEPARLSVWQYEPNEEFEKELVWQTFGRSAWIEYVPRLLENKDAKTRAYIEEQIGPTVGKLHEISGAVFMRRNRSPLPLPLSNFRSTSTRQFKARWYANVDANQLRERLKTAAGQFQLCRGSPPVGFRDDRGLIYAPAKNTECHGKPHPIGADDKCFIAGRFRFGAALFPGFHYDVRTERGLLSCTLEDCAGQPRDLTPEKREYINVFPNDHLLPEK